MVDCILSSLLNYTVLYCAVLMASIRTELNFENFNENYTINMQMNNIAIGFICHTTLANQTRFTLCALLDGFANMQNEQAQSSIRWLNICLDGSCTTSVFSMHNEETVLILWMGTKAKLNRFDLLEWLLSRFIFVCGPLSTIIRASGEIEREEQNCLCNCCLLVCRLA